MLQDEVSPRFVPAPTSAALQAGAAAAAGGMGVSGGAGESGASAGAASAGAAAAALQLVLRLQPVEWEPVVLVNLEPELGLLQRTPRTCQKSALRTHGETLFY